MELVGFFALMPMKDERKTKKQLIEELDMACIAQWISTLCPIFACNRRNQL